MAGVSQSRREKPRLPAGEAPAAWGTDESENINKKVHTMTTIMTGLLKGRIARWGMLAVVLTAAALSLAWMDQERDHSGGKKHFQLGGGWIGSSGVGAWNALQIPLDPAGRTEALRVHLVSYGSDTAGLLAYSGANALSDFIGEGAMISGDTAKWTIVGYGQATGTTLEIRQIWVASGTLKFTGPDSFVNQYTLTVYPAEADADGDGFPDPGATALVTIPGITGSAKRVPLP
jgi:hypothetical protein